MQTMTVLAENLKIIRKNLKCTQMAISDVLGIGFRTYVRYEAGERDAPVAVLVKMAKLGNITLDRLLTAKVTSEDLNQPDSDSMPIKADNLEVVGGSLKEGRLMFKGIKDDFYVSTSANEKKLLNHFRRLAPSVRKKCISDLEENVQKNNSRRPLTGKKKVSKKVLKAKNAKKLKKVAKTIKKITLKG